MSRLLPATRLRALVRPRWPQPVHRCRHSTRFPHPRAFSSSSPSSPSPPSPPSSSPSSPAPAPSSVHTSADYRVLRLHEQSLWHSQFARPPFPNSFHPTHTLPAFIALHSSLPPSTRLPSHPVRLTGRIVSRRPASAKLLFLTLQSSHARLQVLCTRSAWLPAPGPDDGWALLRHLRVGDVIGVEGYPGTSQRGELSLIPTAIHPLVACLHDLPLALPPSSHPLPPAPATSVESRFRQRYLDLLLRPDTVDVLRVRGLVLATLRSFFIGRGYLEVETPVLWPTAGGATARPFVTQSHALGTGLYLRVAPELFLKQLVIGGVDRCFEVSKVFRNEGVDATHNPEFTTVEAYEAYADYEAMMRLTEELLRDIVRAVKRGRGKTGDDLTVRLPAREGTEEEGEEVVDFAPAFQRLDITETLQAKLGGELPDPNSPASVPRYLELYKARGIPLPGAPHTLPRLLDGLIGHYVESMCVQPTFVMHHPVSMSPLAYAKEGARVTERWELFIGGREYINAYSELNDPVEQARRMKVGEGEKAGGDEEAQGVDDEYLKAMEYGLPPTGGWGMGVDRLVMLLTGSRHIRDVIFFPIMKKEQAQGHKQPDAQVQANT